MDVKVSLNVARDADGNVTCDLACGGQQARLIFTGTEVFVEVPEPVQEST
jgi:hypothetical protein